jgi:predicted acyl esterase
MIPMRDRVRLQTVILGPSNQQGRLPILLLLVFSPYKLFSRIL